LYSKIFLDVPALSCAFRVRVLDVASRCGVLLRLRWRFHAIRHSGSWRKSWRLFPHALHQFRLHSAGCHQLSGQHFGDPAKRFYWYRADIADRLATANSDGSRFAVQFVSNVTSQILLLDGSLNRVNAGFSSARGLTFSHDDNFLYVSGNSAAHPVIQIFDGRSLTMLGEIRRLYPRPFFRSGRQRRSTSTLRNWESRSQLS
jgi:hypothetical protein